MSEYAARVHEGLELTPRYNKILNLYLDGMKQSEIAREVGITDSAISIIVNAPNFQHQLAVRQEMRNSDVDKRAVNELVDARDELKRNACVAAKKLVEQMESPIPMIAIRAVENVLDRTGIPRVSKSDITSQTAVIMLDAKTAQALKEGLLED